jgi:hypothetical protein
MRERREISLNSYFRDPWAGEGSFSKLLSTRLGGTQIFEESLENDFLKMLSK